MSIFRDEFLGNFPEREIQCYHRFSVGQCQSKAAALMVKETTSFKDPVPALCFSCCLIELDRMKPGEIITFQRLDTKGNSHEPVPIPII